MAELSENCREILDRFFARDESYQTIGAALDIPSGTIASRISRCLSRLREVFDGKKIRRLTRRVDGDPNDRLRRTTPRRAHQGPPARAHAWVEAAQELPLARGQLDDIVARAEADLAFRDALIANLEDALRLEGYEPDTIPLDELRRRTRALVRAEGEQREGPLLRSGPFQGGPGVLRPHVGNQVCFRQVCRRTLV